MFSTVAPCHNTVVEVHEMEPRYKWDALYSIFLQGPQKPMCCLRGLYMIYIWFDIDTNNTVECWTE